MSLLLMEKTEAKNLIQVYLEGACMSSRQPIRMKEAFVMLWPWSEAPTSPLGKVRDCEAQERGGPIPPS
jgi:hypothetical protein